MRSFHLLPVIGIAWIWIYKKDFSENNPFNRDNFTNSDFSKDPYVFFVYQFCCVIFFAGVASIVLK
jgi:hypothetical protein